VVDQLRAYAEAAERAVPTAPAVQPRRRPPWRVIAIAAVLAIVAGVAALVDVGGGTDDGSLVRTGRPRVPSSITRWESMPPAPLDPRTLQATVATDDELIVWGGQYGYALDDGAAFSFESRRWRTLPASPLSARSSPLAVWTGRMVLVVGGVGPDGDRGDGAAYDPVADRWMDLPEAPFVAYQGFSSAAWTGTQLVVTNVQGRANQFLPSDTYALDPETGIWRALPRAPVSATHGTAAWWEGEVLAVVSLTGSSPVVINLFDPATGSWRAPITTEVAAADLSADSTSVAFGEGRVVIVGRTGPGAIYDFATGRLTRIPSTGSEVRVPAAYVGGVVLSGDLALEPGGKWVSAHTPAGGAQERWASVVHDGRLYVWGGRGCRPGGCHGLTEVATGRIWTPPPPAGSALIQLQADAACGPNDARVVQVRLRSDEARDVEVEILVVSTSREAVVGRSDQIFVPADHLTTELVPFTREDAALRGPHPVVNVRVVDRQGSVLARSIVPLEGAPHCG
jgi:hypothetical protein